MDSAMRHVCRILLIRSSVHGIFLSGVSVIFFNLRLSPVDSLMKRMLLLHWWWSVFRFFHKMMPQYFEFFGWSSNHDSTNFRWWGVCYYVITAFERGNSNGCYSILKQSIVSGSCDNISCSWLLPACSYHCTLWSWFPELVYINGCIQWLKNSQQIASTAFSTKLVRNQVP